MAKNWKPPFLAAYEQHGTVTAAAKVAGISRETAYKHRRVDEAFAAEWEKLENAVTELLEKTVVEIALDDKRGHDQVRALEFCLRARRPAKYREGLKLEHSGKVNVELEEGVNEAVEQQAVELQRLTERLAELAPDGEASGTGGPAGGAVAPAS